MSNPTAIAVDANVLLDFAKEIQTVQDCLEVVKQRLPACKIFVLPTIIQELAAISVSSYHSLEENRLGLKVLKGLLSWGFTPINCLPVGHGIVQITGDKLRSKKFLPEQEINDSYFLAEAALANVSILITSDHHLLEINHKLLKAELESCDLGCPLIQSPKQIVSKFYRKKD